MQSFFKIVINFLKFKKKKIKFFIFYFLNFFKLFFYLFFKNKTPNFNLFSLFKHKVMSIIYIKM